MHKPRRKIRIDKWYLVDTIITYNPRMLKVDFHHEQDVLDFISNSLEGSLRWDCIKGVDAIVKGLTFKEKHPDLPSILIYNYPPDCLSNQDKKSYRTQYRRDERKNRK